LGETTGGATSNPRHLASGDLLGRDPRERLSPALRAHLESCRPCRRLRDEVEGLVVDMRSDRDPEPSEALLRRAALLLPRRPRPAPSLAERIVETVGRLIPAPALDTPVAEAVRGPQGVTALRFDVHGIQVRCQLSRGADGGRLVGQVVRDDGSPPPVVASVEASGEECRVAPVSEHGLFVLDRLPEEPFELLLLGTDDVLKLVVDRTAQP
jgi:hypothetical protein